jgi:hypothetical protein
MPMPSTPQRRPACLVGHLNARIEHAKGFDLCDGEARPRRLGNPCVYPLAEPRC